MTPIVSAGSDTVQFLRAATLAERLPAGPADPGASRVRVEQWRAQEPFADQDMWRARLAEHGLDEAGLAAVLDEPASAPAQRLPEPAWVADLLATLDGDGAEDGPSIPDPEHPFLVAVAPLLTRARARLATELSGIRDGRLDPAALLDQLYASLPPLIHRMMLRAAVTELHRARRAGRLCGDGPRERFASFVDWLGTSAGRRDLLTRYPVLARQIAVGVRLWEQTAATFAARLSADHDAIGETFLSGGDPGTVVEVTGGLGDRHRGWATVMSVRWSGGLQLIYKPRPVSGDVHFQRLLDWLNGQGVMLPFRTLAYLDRGDHGWAEFARPHPCDDDGGLHRFYRRQGGLLALLHVLHATDFHAENLVAAGEQPVLVDLESLFEPGFPFDGPAVTSAERIVADATRGSVLGVGLLPSRLWMIHSERGADLSGLGQVPGVPAPLAMPKIVDPGTDTMRVELSSVELGGGDHRPVPDGAPLRLLDFAGDILDGFTEVYRICERERERLLAPAGPVMAFADDQVRVVLRPTMWYGALLVAGTHPELLRDGLARDRHFDRLWRMVPQRRALAGCIPSERRDLWQTDVPIFSARVGGETLFDSAGRPVPGVVLTPGLRRVRERLAALGDDDLVRQRWLIRASLGTTVVELSATTPLPSYQPRQVVEPLPAERLVQVADVLGHRLARIGFASTDSAQWLGLNSDGGHTWSVGPLRADLFHGLTGVALFLGRLGDLTGDGARTALARKAMATAIHQIEQRGELDGRLGLAGLPGAAYAAGQLARLLDDDTLADRAVSWLARARPAIMGDLDLDFTSGSAGTIAAAAAVHRHHPADVLLDIVRACAERLMTTAERHPAGVGWLPRMLRDSGKAQVPIAGFGHGTAGIVWPLLLAGRLLNDDRYTRTARAAVTYEQSLFRPELGLWAEMRNPAALGVAAGEPPPVAWCYGAMGIGLSRVLSRPYLSGDPVADHEIEVALTTTRRQGFGQCHALCHGDIGNVELLLHAAGVLGRPELREQAGLQVAAAVAGARQQGWVCGTPLGVETPGLMVGLAGTGYGLLRMADPDRVPAVLALAP